MKKNKNKKKRVKIKLGFLIILIGTFIIISKYAYLYLFFINNEKKASTFLIKNNKILDTTALTNIKYNRSDNYTALLEIPSISLKQVLVSKDSKTNNISKNIQILEKSDMPDKDGGIFILAAHSGSSHISFFKNLHKLSVGDLINVYYQNVKYSYKVTRSYEELKDGDISINKTSNKRMLVLTTCSQANKEKQIVVTAYLDVEEEKKW